MTFYPPALADNRRVTDEGPPLAVTVSTERTMGSSWFVDGEIDCVPSRDDWHEWRAWLDTHDMRLPLYDRLRLLIEGTSPQAVVLHRLRFHILERKTPHGMVLMVEPGFGAALIPRWFSVHLGSGSEHTPKPLFDTPDFPYTVHQADPELFVIDLSAGDDDDLTWVMELDWSCAGRSGTLRIDDEGRPFRSFTYRGRPRYEWDLFGAGWRRL